MGNKKKYFLLAVAAITVVSVAIGFYMYNQGPVNIPDANSEQVAASDLYATFLKDSSTAKKNYTNKILDVSGTVTLVTENQQHQPVVMLKTNTEGASVNCTMEGIATGVQPGGRVIIKGICNGMGEGDADLGIIGDLYLVRCYLSK